MNQSLDRKIENAVSLWKYNEPKTGALLISFPYHSPPNMLKSAPPAARRSDDNAPVHKLPGGESLMPMGVPTPLLLEGVADLDALAFFLDFSGVSFT